MKQMGIQEIKEIRMWQFFTLSSRSSSWRFNNIGNAVCCEHRGIPATVAPDQESLSKETGLKNEYSWTQENDQKGKSGQWEQRVHRCLKSYPTLRSFSLTLYRGVWGEWESDLWTSGGNYFILFALSHLWNTSSAVPYGQSIGFMAEWIGEASGLVQWVG